MKKILLLLLAALSIAGCKDDGRTYIGEDNYYTLEPSELFKSDFATYQQRDFPRYFIHRAKEWPREDLNDASSYDLPRVQFTWANLSNDSGYEPDPMYNEYEGRKKIWSMKTDGTDLRLVTDLPWLGKDDSSVGKTSRSPNNRYVAVGYGSFNKLFDIKTQQMIELPHKRKGPAGFLWAEDSSYVYYRTGMVGRVVYKWDLAKGEAEKTDLYISDTGFIKDGKRYQVNDYAALVYDAKTNKKEKIVYWDKELATNKSKAHYKAISPEGDIVWAANRNYHNVFVVDLANGKQIERDGAMQYAIGLNNRFSLTNYNAMLMSVQNNLTKQAWSWSPLGYSRTRDPAIVYNLSANQGNWFKEGE
ncbi:YncE family protein [Vibrio harveyi]|uniref:YncE family protein n=1 Tax=Vibrio harveyi TaxID=669 RepID=UPI003CE9D73B